MPIEDINAAALALRAAAQHVDILPHVPPKLRRRIAPYYGYIEVQIADCKPFYMLSNNDDYVAERFFWDGPDAYEPTSLRLWTGLSRVSPVVLDVGAYTGLFALAAAVANHRTKVLAFEPLDRVYFRLLTNKHVNQLGNLQAFNMAVAEVAGERELSVYSGESVLVTGSTLQAESKARASVESKTVRTTTIDEQVGERVGVNLIKADVEGAEHLVLQGGLGAIEAHRPDILCEVLPEAESLGVMTEQMAALGYRFLRILEEARSVEEIARIEPAAGDAGRNVLLTTRSVPSIESVLAGAAPHERSERR